MVSSNILAIIRQNISDILAQKQRPVYIKMSEETWAELCHSEMAVHFGDVDTKSRKVLGISVLIDNMLPLKVARVYIDWATAKEFPYG